MPKTMKTKDDIRTPLNGLLQRYAISAGADLNCAIRDVLTELMHLCDDSRLNFYDRLCAARKVYRQERSITHYLGDQDHEC